MRTRSVTVDVPDNENAEGAVRVAAASLCAGQEILVMRIPAGIPPEEIPSIVQHFSAMLATKEAFHLIMNPGVARG